MLFRQRRAPQLLTAAAHRRYGGAGQERLRDQTLQAYAVFVAEAAAPAVPQFNQQQTRPPGLLFRVCERATSLHASAGNRLMNHEFRRSR